MDYTTSSFEAAEPSAPDQGFEIDPDVVYFWTGVGSQQNDDFLRTLCCFRERFSAAARAPRARACCACWLFQKKFLRVQLETAVCRVLFIPKKIFQNPQGLEILSRRRL